MRDLVFILAFLFILYATFKRPFIGAAMWLWVAMHFPNGWVYGFAGNFRYNLIIVLSALLSYFIWKHKPKIKPDGLNFLIGLFLIWTVVTSAFTISISEIVWDEWVKFLKVTLFYFFSIAVLRSKLHINLMLWALALSIGFYGCLEGLKYISSGGGHRIAGLSGHVLGDRNELALAFNMVLPLLVYLIGITKTKWIKYGLICAVLLNVIAIFGTYSRGGLLALFIVGGYFWWQSRRKFLYAFFTILIMSASFEFLPSSWHERMDTIETADQDLSFLGRVLAWKHAVLVANDNIITGGGFKASQVSYIWRSYDAAGSFNYIIETGHLSHIGFKAAHSIYFQVLGDHGYIGLLLYLGILLTAFRKANAIIKRAKQTNQDKETVNLCRLLKVSLLAYCAGGAGVSLAYFDMLYALMAVMYVIDHRIIPKQLLKQELSSYER